MKELSKCHSAEMHTQCADEGICHYTCSECGKPCDPKPVACFGKFDKEKEYCNKVCRYGERCIKQKQ